jgi:hypothetical protein
MEKITKRGQNPSRKRKKSRIACRSGRVAVRDAVKAGSGDARDGVDLPRLQCTAFDERTCSAKAS